MISIGIQAPKAKGYALPQKNWPADPKIANKLNQHLSILKTTVMKKLIFPAVAALALGLASCSSDEVNPGNGGQPSFAQGGYAKVAINLPSQSGSSRAVSDGDQGKFDDGLASEYKVNDATLVLFTGASEDKATFHSAYNLTVSMNGVNDATNQITTTTKIVQKVNDGKTVSGDKLYALVVLNNNGLFSVTDNHLKFTGETANFVGKLSDLQKKTVAAGGHYANAFTTQGLLMTNAPLATAPGGGSLTTAPTGEVKTLVNFTDAVYKSEAEAQSKPATEIFVERAVGKVTMQKANGTMKAKDLTYDDATSTSTKPEWTIESWDLDVTNQKSYLVRNTTATHATDWNGLRSKNVDNYRFVGSNKVKDGVNFYRTYWAEDPNYASFTATDFKYLGPAEVTDFSDKLDNDHPKYCFENTFDVLRQNKQGTTRAIVKVKIGTGSDFYTFNGDKSHLYNATNKDARVKAVILADPRVEKWELDNGLKAGTSSVTALNWNNREESTGEVTIKDFTVSNGAKTYSSADLLAASGKANLKEALGLGKILEYTGGYAYYPIRIKHFGNTLTPWNKEASAPGDDPTPEHVYPVGTGNDQANNYLGRYGVLRNNWYDLEVTGITALGEPVVPSVDTDDSADDDLYNYIAVRINVLSWAKRKQDVEL